MKLSLLLKTIGISIFFYSLLIFNSPLTRAQGWERNFDWNFGSSSLGYSVQEINNGNYVITGQIDYLATGFRDIFVYSLHSSGDTLWTKKFGNGGQFNGGKKILTTSDGGFIVLGYVQEFPLSSTNLFLIKFDAADNLVWTKTLINAIDGEYPSSLAQTSDGGYIIIGQRCIDGVGCFILLVKTDSVGNEIWSKTIGSGNEDGISVQQTLDNGFILTANYNDFFPQTSTIHVIKTDSLGNILWDKGYNKNINNMAGEIYKTNDGGYILSAFSGSDFFQMDLSYIMKLDSNGDSLWLKTILSGTNKGINSFAETSDNGFILVGLNPNNNEPFGYNNMCLIKTDSLGNFSWIKSIESIDHNYGPYSVCQTSDLFYLITGYRRVETDNCSCLEAFLLKTDSIGNTVSNILSGTVFYDVDSNCTFNDSDVLQNNRIIKIQPGNNYVTTNFIGEFNVLVDTGTFLIECINPNNLWEQICPINPSIYSVQFSAMFESSDSIYFANKIAIYCPLLTVDISTWALRPCMQSTYTVNYCNNGTIPADSAFIEIEFDYDISPVSSSLPWSSVNGNVYTFNLGTVAVNQCGTFYITADISCSAVLGSTHCVLAHIYPDSICTPVDTGWDKSSVMVEGICTDDSLACFTIYNTGENMDGTSQWRIYENNVLIETGSFQLNAGDSLVICRSANGQTIRLEADQRPGHPGSSHPNANVEMCGGFAPASLGMILQQPEDDFDEFVEMDCRPVTGSYDPNEKLVKPSGTTANHNIDSTDVLEYQINFQNTGTDTAFRVVIRDTLSQKLDITTVQSGASSHPYSFRIYGHGILEWTFNNILLPDSNVNEPMSHGFVRYKVNQNAGNTLGTVIENRAAIYFDYNAPVITNTAFNTVWKEQVLSVQKIYENNVGIVVYPNPFTSATTVMVPGEIRNFEFILYNLPGEEIRAFSMQNNSLQFERNSLGAGIYIYKVFSKEGLIGAGKVVIE